MIDQRFLDDLAQDLKLPEDTPTPEMQLASANTGVTTDGGAFVGYRMNMPKGLNTPENMAKQSVLIADTMAGGGKGGVQGFLGLPGDLESIGRMALNYLGYNVDENTALPTSEEIGKRLESVLGPVIPPNQTTGVPTEERVRAAEGGELGGELLAPGGQLKVAGKVIKATKDLPVGMSIKVLDDPLPVDKVTRNKNFKAWAQGNEIKDDAGKPLVLYHGTTHDFDEFTLERANPQNYFGEGFYFTDKVEDANRNYAGVGGDLRNRIESRIDELDGEFADPLGADQNIAMDAKRTGVNLDLFYDTSKQSFNDLDRDTKRQIWESIARNELMTNQGTVMPVFAKMQNPVKLGTKDETRYVIDTKFDDETGDFLEESGNGIDLLNAFKQTADEWGIGDEVDDAYGALVNAFADGEVTAGKVDEVLRNTLTDLYDIDGNYTGPGKFIANMFRNMGYDGIVMNAEEYFGPDLMTKGMQGVKNANHYILFEPTNIKSAIGNRGTFDPKDPSILKGVGVGGTGAAMSQEENK
jgi:hypothetical protein